MLNKVFKKPFFKSVIKKKKLDENWNSNNIFEIKNKKEIIEIINNTKFKGQEKNIFDKINNIKQHILNNFINIPFIGNLCGDLMFIYDPNISLTSIKNQCRNKCIRYDDVFWIQMTIENENEILYENILKQSEIIYEIIKIIKPKLIITFGEISTNIIRQNKNLENSCRGKKKYNPFNNNNNNNNNDEKHYFKFYEKLNNIYFNENHLSTFYNNESKFISRVLSYYESNSCHKYSTTKFSINNDFENLIKSFKLNPIEWFEKDKFVDESGLEHIKYNDPDEIFYNNKFFIENDKIFDFNINNKLLMDVKTIEYNNFKNIFDIFGRTKEGYPIHLITYNHWFNFYIKIIDDDGSSYNENNLRELKFAIQNNLKFNKGIDCTKDLFLKLETKDIRNALKFEKFKSKSINLKFNNFKYFREIKEALIIELQAKNKQYELFESFLKPKENFLLNNNIYMNGWIKINKSNLIQIINDQKNSIGSYEFKVNTKKIKGYSPINGEERNEFYETCAPAVWLSVDYEMKGFFDKFPKSDESPIILLCASLYTTNNNIIKAIEYERTNQTVFDGKQTEVRKTGQVEPDELFAFILGKVDKKKYKIAQFSRKLLPNIPRLTKEQIKLFNNLQINNIVKEKNIKKINVYFEKLIEWIKYVGLLRAKQIYKHSKNILDQFENKYKLNSNNYDEKIKENLQIINYVRKYNKSDIINFKDENDWSVIFNKSNPKNENTLKLFGLIQCNYKIVNKKPKIRSFEDEKKLLEAFEKLRIQVNFDILTGYNIDNFDEPYNDSRKKLLGVVEKNNNRIHSCSALKSQGVRFKKKNFSSKATGVRKFTEVLIPGRTVFDLFNYTIREMKLRSYTLNSVSESVLNQTKIDLPYQAIDYTFKLNRGVLICYGSWDTILPYSIINTLGLSDFLTSLSRMVSTMSIGELYSSGQQKKILMIFLRFLKKDGLYQMMPDINHFNQYHYVETGAGAKVFDNMAGWWNYIPLLDYQSLYPSIMRSLNLSHNVMGIYEDIIKWGFNIDEDCIKTIKKYVNYKTNNSFDMVYYYFLKNKSFTKNEIISKGYNLNECEMEFDNDSSETYYIPKILIGSLQKMTNNLLISRKKVKNLMFQAKPGSNEFIKRFSEQLTLKLMANAVYGGTGSETSLIAARQIQESVTLEGQKHVIGLADLLEKIFFECKIIGGDTDSVFPKFYRIKKIGDLFEEVTIDKIANLDELSKLKNFKIDILKKKPFIEYVVDVGNCVLPKTMKLEFEAVYTHFFPALKEGSLTETAKKKVACMMVEPVYNWEKKKWIIPDKSEIFYKGLEAKRRDSPMVVQNTMTNFFKILFNSKIKSDGEIESINYLKKKIEKVRKGNINISKLIITKQYGDNYKTNKQSHLALIKKMKIRGDLIPEVGTRIPYVLITSYKSKNYQKIDDPVYVIENNLQIDYESYVRKIFKALTRFTNQFIDSPLLSDNIPNFKNAKDSNEKAKIINKYIFGYIKNETKKDLPNRLFQNERHNQKINIDKSMPFYDFIIKEKNCMSCDKIFKYGSENSNQKLCNNCQKNNVNLSELLNNEKIKLDNLKKEKERILKICRICFRIDHVPEYVEIKCNNFLCLKNYSNKTNAEINVKKSEQKIIDIEDLI